MGKLAEDNKIVNAVSLTDIVLSRDEMDEKGLPQEQIYSVLSDGEEYGPIWRDDLKAYLRVNGILYKEGKVKNIRERDWIDLSIHPTFQRRKPQVAGKVKGKKEQFHIVLRGIKQGPFSISEIKQELENNNILYTDMVSTDSGKNWIKIYQVDQLDRRGSKVEDTLPELPKSKTFNISNEEIQDFLENSGDRTQAAIAGLAKIGQSIKNKKVKTTEDVTKRTGTMLLDQVKLKRRKMMYYIAGACTLLMAIIVLIGVIKTSRDKSAKVEPPKKTISTTTKTVRPVKKTKKVISSRPKARARRPAVKRPRRPSRPSPRKRRYDRGKTPVEQDPVRSNISRKTLAPPEDDIIEEVLPDDLPPEDDLEPENLEDDKGPIDDLEEDVYGDDALMDPGEDGVAQEGEELYE